MSWFDILLVLSFSALIALGVQRRLMGLVVGLGAVLLFRPLLIVLNGSPYIALVFALIAGLLLGLGSRFFLVRRVGTGLPFQILGGIGGTLLGCLLVLSVVTSLPIERNVNQQIVYPPNSLPKVVSSAVRKSRFVTIGRGILLYPLLEPSSNFSGGTKFVYKNLHDFLVIGKPWEGSTN